MPSEIMLQRAFLWISSCGGSRRFSANALPDCPSPSSGASLQLHSSVHPRERDYAPDLSGAAVETAVLVSIDLAYP